MDFFVKYTELFVQESGKSISDQKQQKQDMADRANQRRSYSQLVKSPASSKQRMKLSATAKPTRESR